MAEPEVATDYLNWLQLLLLTASGNLNWPGAQATEAWSSLPHWQAQITHHHYEIQGGALEARAWPG